MAELKEGTLKITVTEAALKMLGEQSEAFHQRGGYLGGVTGSDQLRPEYLAQCDKCLAFCAREEVGSRDESRTECRDCHEHDWRCDEDFGEDNLPEEGAPMDKVQAALETLQNSVPEFRHRTKVDIVQEYLSQEYHIRITLNSCAPLCDYHAHSPGWDECTDGQECSHRSKEDNAIVVGDCPKCGRVMAIPVGGGFECRYHDCK